MYFITEISFGPRSYIYKLCIFSYGIFLPRVVQNVKLAQILQRKKDTNNTTKTAAAIFIMFSPFEQLS